MNSKKGFTLTELVIGIVVTVIVGLAIVITFVTEHRLRVLAHNRIAVAREADIALNHMVRILRFAEKDTVTTGADYVSATIEGGHLDSIPSEINIRFERFVQTDLFPNKANVVTYNVENEGEYFVAENITALACTWDDPYLEITLTAEDMDRSVPIQTKIMVMAE